MLDAGLFLVLHFAGGVVACVFLQVTFFAALVNFGGDDGAVSNKCIELVFELLLGFRCDVLLLILSHKGNPITRAQGYTRYIGAPTVGSRG